MSALSRAVAQQLHMPGGVGGWLTGQAMRLVNRRPNQLAIAALRIRPGDTVLDLGCGTGDAVPHLLRAADDVIVHGIDHADAMVRAARRRNPNGTFHRASFDRLPFADATIDRILATNVAYFWVDAPPILAEIARVLRPGGRLALYVTDGALLARLGLRPDGARRGFRDGDLDRMLGPAASVERVRIASLVEGFVATIDAETLTVVTRPGRSSDRA